MPTPTSRLWRHRFPNTALLDVLDACAEHIAELVVLRLNDRVQAETADEVDRIRTATEAGDPDVPPTKARTAARMDYLMARPFLSMAEAEELVSISRTTLLKARRRGDLPARKLGEAGSGGRVLIKTSELLKWASGLPASEDLAGYFDTIEREKRERREAEARS